MPLPLLLGKTVEECKNLLGEVLEAYSYEGRTKELEFQVVDQLILVVPVLDIVLKLSLRLNEPPTDVLEILGALSGRGDWLPDPLPRPEVAQVFGVMPDHPNHTFYRTSDGSCYGLSTRFTMFRDNDYRVNIVTVDFLERLRKLPSEYDKKKPAPDQPFFFFNGQRFMTRIGQPGPFEHYFGHAADLSIQRPPRKCNLHQVVNLDLRDPALGLTVPGLTRLPLIYCFQNEVGRMEYDVLSDHELRIAALNESGFVDDFPYENYPEAFPKHSFSLTVPEPSTLQEFGNDVWQGIKPAQGDKLICIVPSSPLYGVHLWHEDSDCDDVHVKFFFDTSSRHVVVYNECD